MLKFKRLILSRCIWKWRDYKAGYNDATELYKAVRDGGYMDGWNKYGWFYFYGKGVPIDANTTLAAWSNSCQLNNATGLLFVRHYLFRWWKVE